MVFIVLSGFIEVRLANSRMAVDTLLVFFFGKFRSPDHKGREKYCYAAN